MAELEDFLRPLPGFEGVASARDYTEKGTPHPTFLFPCGIRGSGTPVQRGQGLGAKGALNRKAPAVLWPQGEEVEAKGKGQEQVLSMVAGENGLRDLQRGVSARHLNGVSAGVPPRLPSLRRPLNRGVQATPVHGGGGVRAGLESLAAAAPSRDGKHWPCPRPGPARVPGEAWVPAHSQVWTITQRTSAWCVWPSSGKRAWLLPLPAWLRLRATQ